MLSPQEICIRVPWLVRSIVAADLGIWFAYFWMPFSLWRIQRRVRAAGEEVPLPSMWTLGRSFVGWCGMTHLIAAAVVYFVIFRVLLGLLIGTALISLLTAVLLHRIVPQAAHLIIDMQRWRREVARGAQSTARST